MRSTPPPVRRLLRQQHPDLSRSPLARLATGWDNVVFRLGQDLCVRLSRRLVAARLMDHELHWLPQLVGRLSLPTPAPLRAGRPGFGYPWAWAITPWLPGDVAARSPISDPGAAALALGEFVAALRRLGPVPRCGCTVTCTPANLLVRAGQVSAVIDFGDLTAGDPATDLSVAWMLFEPAERRVFRNAAGGCDDATWARARGNALAHALGCLASSADDPVMAAIGRRTLDAVLADPR